MTRRNSTEQAFARPYSEYYEDEPDARRDSSRPEQTMAGWHGFLMSATSAGLLLLIGVLWFVTNEVNQGRQNQGMVTLLVITILLLNLVAFATSLFGIVLSSRGMSRTQVYHRGYATTGMILGVVTLLAGFIVGLVSMCFGLITHLG
jgi:hypothetical protein